MKTQWAGKGEGNPPLPAAGDTPADDWGRNPSQGSMDLPIWLSMDPAGWELGERLNSKTLTFRVQIFPPNLYCLAACDRKTSVLS